MARQLTRQERLNAYEKAVALARDNALIIQAVGGVVVMLHPDTADKQGYTPQMLRMAESEETPCAHGGECDGTGPECCPAANVGYTDDF